MCIGLWVYIHDHTPAPTQKCRTTINKEHKIVPQLAYVAYVRYLLNEAKGGGSDKNGKHQQMAQLLHKAFVLISSVCVILSIAKL